LKIYEHFQTLVLLLKKYYNKKSKKVSAVGQTSFNRA